MLPGDKKEAHHHHHHHHHEHHPQHGDQHDPYVGEKNIKDAVEHQNPRSGKSLSRVIDFSTAVADGETGLKCVIETAKIDTVEKESLLSCTHSLVNACHYTYVTRYRPSREEEFEVY